LIAGAKVQLFFELTNFLGFFFRKKCFFIDLFTESTLIHAISVIFVPKTP
jgi:hypothetical protein